MYSRLTSYHNLASFRSYLIALNIVYIYLSEWLCLATCVCVTSRYSCQALATVASLHCTVGMRPDNNFGPPLSWRLTSTSCISTAALLSCPGSRFSDSELETITNCFETTWVVQGSLVGITAPFTSLASNERFPSMERKVPGCRTSQCLQTRM